MLSSERALSSGAAIHHTGGQPAEVLLLVSKLQPDHQALAGGLSGPVGATWAMEGW